MKISDEFTRQDIDRLLRRAADYYNVSQEWTVKMAWFSDNKHLSVYWVGARLEEDSYESTDDWWFMKEDGTWFSCEQWHAGEIDDGES